jgi:peroxiredoxin
MPLLDPGDSFPSLTVTKPGGPSITVPDALACEFGVVLFYRGSWCPYCNAQLHAFHRASAGLVEVGAKFVALSVDDEATTTAMVAKHGLTFPVGHSADAAAVSAATGACVDPEGGFFSPPGSCWTRRARGGQRLFLRRDRPARAGRRRRPDPLPARARRRVLTPEAERQHADRHVTPTRINNHTQGRRTRASEST